MNLILYSAPLRALKNAKCRPKIDFYVELFFNKSTLPFRGNFSCPNTSLWQVTCVGRVEPPCP